MKFNTHNLRRASNYSQAGKSNRRKLSNAVCGVELLEGRCLMSVAQFQSPTNTPTNPGLPYGPAPYGISLSNGVLRINGGDIGESADVSMLNGKVHATLSHVVYIQADINTTIQTIVFDAMADFDPAAVSSIAFWGNGGNDSFTNDTFLPSSAWGGEGSDYLVGGFADDNLNGGNGDDQLEGRGGDDMLNGNAGNDTYVFAGQTLGSDTITEAASVDSDTIDLGDLGKSSGRYIVVMLPTSASLDLAQTTQQTVMAGHLSLALSSSTGIENVVGSGWGDTIKGNARANLIQGMGGADLIHGNDGNDSVYGGDSNDVLFQDNGGGLVYGDNGNDRLYAGTSATNLVGGAGDDTLMSIGGSHSDTCTGSSGFDSFWLDSEATETTDASQDEINYGHVHRVAAFSENKIVNGNTVTMQTPSRDRLGQNIIDPILEDSNLYAKLDFSANPLFATTGPSVNDIDQGAVGDCYFVAALSAIAKTNPDKIRQLVTDLGDGTYVVNFHKAGQNAFVRVDGDLWAYSATSPIFAGLGGQNALWVAIVEKAYALFKNNQGTYESINGGNGAGVATDEALAAPKGSFPTTDYANATALLSAMRSQLLAGKAITVGGLAPFLPSTVKNNVDNPNTGADENTFHRGAHVYTLISVASDLSSVVLRNPWADDGGGSDADPSDGYVTIPADLVFYCSGGFATYTV